MSDKVIVFKNPETGGVSVVNIHPMYQDDDKKIAEIVAKAVPPDTSWRMTDRSSLPADRKYRNAWTDDLPGEQIDIDIPKARDIHMARIREARNKQMPGTDVEMFKALEALLEGTLATDSAPEAAEVLRVISKRKALRDTPQNTDLSAANTPEQLDNLWPDGLLREDD